MNVRDIIKSELLEVGADGLASDDCGCGIDDLQPCEGGCMGCVPALRVLDSYNNQPIYIEIGSADLYVRAPLLSALVPSNTSISRQPPSPQSPSQPSIDGDGQ